MAQSDPDDNTTNGFPDFFHIVPIERGPDRKKWKAPQTKGWNDDAVASQYPSTLYDGFNGGICHKQSNTCAIDVDNLKRARELFTARGLDLNRLLMTGCQISSGRDNRSKLLYKLPAEVIMLGAYPRLRQIAEPDGMVMEFRCVYGTGKTCQDVAPGSIHPDNGQHYTWINPNPEIPVIPTELLQWWYELIPKNVTDFGDWAGTPDTPEERTLVTRALKALSPDISYPEWINVGMALHDTGWLDAFELWDDWSSYGTDYDPDYTLDTWETFNHGEGINIYKIHAMATEVNPAWRQDTAQEMFAKVQGQSPVPLPDVQLVMDDPQRIVACRNGGHSLPMAEHMRAYIQMCEWAAGCQMPESTSVCIEEIAKVFGIRRLSDVRDRVDAFTPDSTTVDPGIIAQFYHVRSQHKFYDRGNGVIITAESLNQSWQSGDEKPSDMFKEMGGVSVDNIGWHPCAHDAMVPDVIHMEGVSYANSYRKPQPVPDFIAGDVTPYLNHAKFLIPDDAERESVLDHMAFTMQHPEVKINWQILLFGEQGTGKDTLLLPLARYFGSMYRDIQAGDDNANQWGDTFFKKKVLVYQEVFKPRDQKFANELKTKAASTAGGLDPLNMKGKGQVFQPNLYSMYMFSNHANPLHIGNGDRRIFPVGDHAIKDPGEVYFKPLYAWLNGGGGLLMVVYWLLHRDVTRFNPNQLPFHTTSRGDMVEQSRSETGIALDQMMMLEKGIFDPCVMVFTAEQAYQSVCESGTHFIKGEKSVAYELKQLDVEKLERIERGGRNHRSRVRLWVNPNFNGVMASTVDELFKEYKDTDIYLHAGGSFKIERSM